MSAGFDRLTPALQYQIVNALGWRALRPVQEQTIDAVLDGKNCVVLAPTAGGKTEASFFPILSAMDAGAWRPVSVLYLSPILALINNQEDRVRKYAGLIGRRAFKWHGDVRQGERNKFLRDPADILLTTPESLEAMLMSSRIPARALFEGLQAVIIDEVHAFAGDDRGAHLSSVLERLSRFCGRDVQRIGLSATVGNPEEILRWVQGSSKREGVVVDPKGKKAVPDLSIDFVGGMANAAKVIRALHPGKKRLVFLDSRAKAEELGKLLNQQGVRTFVTHGSLSFTERRDAERAFHEGEDCVIVATSALELGIDVGDLNHVLQIDGPPSVASFLQRMGRTGRTPGTVPNCTFLANTEAGLLQAAAVVQLYREGFVEPIRASRRAAHILAHQIMALAIQLGGVVRGDLWAWLEGPSAFADLTLEEREAVLEHMLSEGILSDQGGRLWLGELGEKRFGSANFRNLYAVFDAPRLIRVQWNANEIGSVDSSFLATLDEQDQPGSFLLGGKPWLITHIEWERGICNVRPAPEGKAPRWGGGSRFLGFELCQAIRRVLIGTGEDAAWSERARKIIQTERDAHAFLQDEPAPMMEVSDEIEWWTFAGGTANVLLARMLETELGGKVTAHNFKLVLKDGAGSSRVAVRKFLEALAAQSRPSEEDARRHAEEAARSRISKFQICLPEPLLLELLSRAATDVAGARRAVQGAITGAQT